MPFFAKKQLFGVIILLFFLISNISKLAAQSFVHPGAMHTQSQISYVKQQVQAGSQPWKAAYDQMLAKADAALSHSHHAIANFNVP